MSTPQDRIDEYFRKRYLLSESPVCLEQALPFADNSFDAVVASLVLCSVREPDTALREIARVLKPGGRYLFLEHIRAPTGSALRWQQEVLHPLHAFCCNGCRLTRQQDRSILRAHSEQLFTAVPAELLG
eukprot:s459_g2.t1